MSHTVMSRLTAQLGCEVELSSRIADLAAAVRKEAGNETFEVFTHAGAVGEWTMIETYRDRTAFETHLGKEHTKAFNMALGKLARGATSDVTELTRACLPEDSAAGIRGIDHVGITVPDIDAAADFLSAAFGAVALYDVQPAGAEPMQGPDVEHQLGLPQGARIEHMRLMRIGSSASLEMFRIANADQRSPADLVDYGLQHIAIYVDDMAAAAQRFRDAGGTLLSAPHPLGGVEDGENNSGVYGRAPWGMLIELISTPDGIDYSTQCVLPRWKPAPTR